MFCLNRYSQARCAAINIDILWRRGGGTNTNILSLHHLYTESRSILEIFHEYEIIFAVRFMHRGNNSLSSGAF